MDCRLALGVGVGVGVGVGTGVVVGVLVGAVVPDTNPWQPHSISKKVSIPRAHKQRNFCVAVISHHLLEISQI
jgi:hypothetical protein